MIRQPLFRTIELGIDRIIAPNFKGAERLSSRSLELSSGNKVRVSGWKIAERETLGVREILAKPIKQDSC